MNVLKQAAKVKQMDLVGEQVGHHSNSPVNILSRWSRHYDNREKQRKVLVLNVLLLGDRQSGRSSVGNAMIGGHEFNTGSRISSISMTSKYQMLCRNFPAYFRRQGAESDLTLRIIDTPPLPATLQNVHELCPEGVHVLVLVVRADTSHKDAHLEQNLESVFGPEWRHHAVLVFTHADQLREAGLQPSDYLTETAADWLRTLSDKVGGGFTFLDNNCDWPLIRGRPLREQVLRLSARNHHIALNVRS